jgi:hypothetical protein
VEPHQEREDQAFVVLPGGRLAAVVDVVVRVDRAAPHQPADQAQVLRKLCFTGEPLYSVFKGDLRHIFNFALWANFDSQGRSCPPGVNFVP